MKIISLKNFNMHKITVFKTRVYNDNILFFVSHDTLSENYQRNNLITICVKPLKLMIDLRRKIRTLSVSAILLQIGRFACRSLIIIN